jgi:hypothetical protein
MVQRSSVFMHEAYKSFPQRRLIVSPSHSSGNRCLSEQKAVCLMLAHALLSSDYSTYFMKARWSSFAKVEKHVYGSRARD